MRFSTWLSSLLILGLFATTCLANPKNPWKVLNLPQSATDDQIKARFRELTKKHHPDRTNDPKSKEIYNDITNAYQTLTDPVAKRKYEQDVEIQRHQSSSHNQGGFGFGGGYSAQTKQSNYNKKWQDAFQKKHGQPYATFHAAKKRTYKSTGSSSIVSWIKNKISGFFSGGFSEILIYGAVIFVIIKVLGSVVHIQTGHL